MTYHLKSRSNIDTTIFDQIVNLVVQGGEVKQNFAIPGLQRAKLIGYVIVNNEVVSTATIKVPNQSYKDSVFHKAGIDDDMGVSYEYGYNVTSPEYRRKGYTTNLNRIIFDHFSLPVFATVRDDNYMSSELLQRSGFVKVGNSYKSTNGNYTLSLYIKK